MFSLIKLVDELSKTRLTSVKGSKYCDVPISFDIETTNLDSGESFMILWGFSFFNKYHITGRSWEEFVSFFDELEYYLKDWNLNIIIWVHNLNFEYAFLYEFMKDKIKSVFAKGEHDILDFKTSRTWWKCSAKLVRLPLDKACDMYGTKTKKLCGSWDYKKIRTKNDELSEEEKQYFIHDLDATNDLIEEVKKQKDIKKLVQMPMTLTGFSRRKLKKSCSSIEYHMKYKSLNLDNEIYSMFDENAKGGVNEIEIFQKNKIFHNVKLLDFVSQYIYIMLCEYFPMSAFKSYPGNPNNLEEVSKVLRDKCCIFDIKFEHLKLKSDKGFGIINTGHVINRNDCKILTKIDNRIIEATNVHLVLNELDLKHILKYYDCPGGFTIWNLYTAFRGRLPYEIRDVIFELLQEKVNLSKYDGTEKEYIYQNKKQELNSIAGMIETKLIRDSWILQKDGCFKPQSMDNSSRYHYLTQYNKSMAHFVYFPWGNYIISHGRDMTLNLIDCVSKKHLYHDTDSCFALEFDWEKVKKLNLDIENKCKKYGYNIGNLGQALLKKENFDLKILSPKTYAISKNGKVEITCAGVPKEFGKYLNNDLSKFEYGFIFPDSMKVAKYSSRPIHEIEVNGVKHTTAGFVYISNQDYILKNNDNISEKLKQQRFEYDF